MLHPITSMPRRPARGLVVLSYAWSKPFRSSSLPRQGTALASPPGASTLLAVVTRPKVWGTDSAAAQQRSKALQVAASTTTASTRSGGGGPRPLSRCSKDAAAVAVGTGACRIGFGAGTDMEARGNGGGGSSGGGASLGRGGCSSRAGVSGGGRGEGQVPLTLPSLGRCSGGTARRGEGPRVRASFEGDSSPSTGSRLLSSFEEGSAMQAEGGGSCRLRPSLEQQRPPGADGAASGGGGGGRRSIDCTAAAARERDVGAPMFSRVGGGGGGGGYGASRLSLDSFHPPPPNDRSTRGGKLNLALQQDGVACGQYASAGVASGLAASKAVASASPVASSGTAASAPAPPLVKAGLLARLFK